MCLKVSKNNVYTDDCRRTVIALMCETGVSVRNCRRANF